MDEERALAEAAQRAKEEAERKLAEAAAAAEKEAAEAAAAAAKANEESDLDDDWEKAAADSEDDVKDSWDADSEEEGEKSAAKKAAVANGQTESTSLPSRTKKAKSLNLSQTRMNHQKMKRYLRPSKRQP